MGSQGRTCREQGIHCSQTLVSYCFRHSLVPLTTSLLPLQVPIYDFRQSKRVGYRTQPVPESRVIILEGIYALSSQLRSVGPLTRV